MSSHPVVLLASSFVGPSRLSGGDSSETVLDVRSKLTQPKNLKFMSKMDQICIEACHRVLTDFPLDEKARAQRTGLYLCVGVLPFEERELDMLGERSLDKGDYSLKKLITEALPSLNPLTTFKCLPNMAAFHLSHNFGLKEAYLVTYPDRFQWAQALQHAIHDLNRGRVDYALVGAVTHQQNPLVINYNKKMGLPAEVFTPDCGGLWLLARAPHVGRALGALRLNYCPPRRVEEIRFKNISNPHLGPVEDLFRYELHKDKKEEISFSYENDFYSYEFSLGAMP